MGSEHGRNGFSGHHDGDGNGNGRDDSDGKSRLHKQLRVDRLAPGTAAAGLTVDQWHAVALGLLMDEHSVLFQIVKGLAAGMPDKAIETALGHSHGTQREYMTRLFTKFNTHSRTEIAAKAMATLIAGPPS